MIERDTFSVEWVRLFQKVAVQQAEKEEEVAIIAAIVKFAQWLQDGPAKGLRRQHRFSKTADGWCETLLAEDEGSSLNERDELDGLSKQQLASVKGMGHSMSKTPAEARQEAN